MKITVNEDGVKYVLPLEVAVSLLLKAEEENKRLREALKWVTDAYDQTNPLRTANMHDANCKCLRCAVDNARAALKGDE